MALIALSLVLIGAALIIAGLAMWSTPAAYIAGGLLLLIAGAGPLLERK